MMEFLFLKIKQSDFWGFSPDISKTAYNEAVFKNGAAGKLVRWRSTPQPDGLAVQELLAFPRRTSAGSVTGRCCASPTFSQHNNH